MINKKQIQTIELLVAGEHNKSEIAEIVGVSRQSLYNWLSDVEFMEKLDKRIQEIKTIAGKELDARLPIALDKYWELAMTTTDARTKEKCLSYWIDRCLGKATSKFDITAEAKQSNMNSDDILSALEDAKSSNVLEDNIIELVEQDQ